MLEVRRVQPGDLNGVTLADQVLCGDEVTVRIGRSGFSLSYLPASRAEWRVFPPADSVGLYLQALSAGDRRMALFAALVEQQVAGVAVAAALGDGWGRLADLRVDIHHRREGAGTALLAACQSFAARQGMAGLRCDVPDSDPVMCQFLEHSGFGVQGLDRLALSLMESERRKPQQQRACLLHFYRFNEKG